MTKTYLRTLQNFLERFFIPKTHNPSNSKTQSGAISRYALLLLAPPLSIPKPSNSPTQLWGNRYYRGYGFSLLKEILSTNLNDFN